MSLEKKIKIDDFVSLDYEKIRNKVSDNLLVDPKTNKLSYHKYIKMSLVSLVAVFVAILSIMLINNVNLEEKYKCYDAAPKRMISFSEIQEEGYEMFLEKLDTFSSKLNEYIYKECGEKQQNYVISPVSIYMALAMVVESGNEKVRNEILYALDMSYDEVKKYTSILYSQLNEEKEKKDFIGSNKTMFRKIMSNSIWVDDSIELKEEGLVNLSNYYNCSSYSAPFKNNNKKANKAIKEYVSDKTQGMINKDLGISDETLFALINTFYLKDVWNYNGDELPLSEEKYFFNKEIETFLIMSHYLPGDIYETEKYIHYYAVTNYGIKMKFIVPKEGYTINDIYYSEVWKEVNNIKDYNAIDHDNLIEYYTRCFFPQFQASFDYDISNILKTGFDIKTIFEFGENFTPLTDSKIVCTEVKHITELKVDRRGIEGSAVTIIPGAGAAGPGEYIRVNKDLIVDKSFMIIITDDKNVPLFTGVINKI